MTRRFDPDAIDAVAKKVGELTDGYSTAGTDLGDGNPGGAYGDLSNAATAGKTMQGFYSAVNTELGAAAKLVDAASQALTNAATSLREDEARGVHVFGGGNPERV